MKTKLINDGAQKTWAIVFDTGDEAVEGLRRFAHEQRLSASAFTGLGAFGRAVLGWFDMDAKDYVRIPIEEQVEVVSLVGDFAEQDGEPKVHPHVVVAKRDGSAHGGHLLEATVRPTLEVIVTESPAHLRRRTDEATGLPLIVMEERA